MNLCNNNMRSNMILSFIDIRKVHLEVLKILGFALGFQHFPQDLTNVMFDPSVEMRNSNLPTLTFFPVVY